ncbi:hypothetical protein, partial [Cesiribacter andamanensis]|uniref:hypothetical protein n=1 Tax=Cesiribacter andamanensis TaxID=649507 RepID=UPI00058E70C9
MLKNYLIIAWRHLAKNRAFTLINVFCLALGMSITLVYIALLSFVATYDSFHAEKDRIYRVVTQVHDGVENPPLCHCPLWGLLSSLK